MVQAADKAEVQETVPPDGVLGAESLSLMPQHFPREPAKRRFQTMVANQFFSTVRGLTLEYPREAVSPNFCATV